MSIIDFKGENYYLSNFYSAPVMYQGLMYKNNEAAFQSAKCIVSGDRSKFKTMPPNIAKSTGRKVQLRPDWESVKEEVMYDVVKDKFTRNKKLAEKLITTYPKNLVEGNWWGDIYWGVCKGEGKNKLGEILMKVRSELMGEEI